METIYPKYRVAAVQAASVYLDRDATVEKTCRLIDEAASNGAKLVAFPEAFICGYPWWVYIGPPAYGQQFHEKLYRNAVEIPGPSVSRIAACCRKNQVYACVSVTEKDGGSLYLTQLWFSPDGDLIGKHRKLKPTNGERYIWGCGDGSMMPVMKTELGNIGGLQCWEHILPINVAAMTAMNVQVHVGGWPGTCDTMKDEWTDLFSSQASANCERYLAIASQSYALFCSQPYTQEMSDILLTEPGLKPPQDLGGAYTCIFNPNGHVIAEVSDPKEEGICYADIDIGRTVAGKTILDGAGHSAVPSVINLEFDKTPKKACTKKGVSEQETITYEELNKY